MYRTTQLNILNADGKKITLKDQNKWGDIPCSWIKRLKIIKTPILPTPTYGFNINAMRKIPDGYLYTNTAYFKSQMESHKPTVTKTIFKNKNEVGGITLISIMPYYTYIVIIRA